MMVATWAAVATGCQARGGEPAQVVQFAGPAPTAQPAAAPAPAAPTPTAAKAEPAAAPAPAAPTPTAAKAEPAADHPPSAFQSMPKLGTKAYCPVSKETFTVTAKTQSAVYKGKTYVFCCPDCKPEFEKTPVKFIN
jgi:YHS domain-containing protein